MAQRRVASQGALKAYIASVSVAATALVASLVVYHPFPSPANVLLGAAFILLICCAELYPVHVAPKTKVSVTTAAVFAIILLFDPLSSVFIVGAGVAASQLFIRGSMASRAFNTAQAMLFSGIGALVYSALGTANSLPALTSAHGVLLAGMAAGVMYLVNSAAVAAAAGFQLRRNPVGIWAKGIKKATVQDLSLFIIGLASAILVKQAPWSIVLMLVPVIVIYYSFKKVTDLNRKVEEQLQDLKHTQAQLVESARMASVGTMVAGIAHQINNPLFVIRGRAETLCEGAEEHLRTPSARKAVQVIFQMADRVSRIVNSLTPETHLSPEGIPGCDVNQLLRNSLQLLESKLLKTGVKVSLAEAADLPLCPANAGEIQEMLVSLVDNACNAMPQGGELVLATLEEMAGISIRLSDSGVGIAPQDLDRIFDPLFTTRQGAGRVGLGLYVSKSIAEKYGGRITVDSKLSTGTEFIVWLPGHRLVTEPKTGRPIPPPKLAVSGSGIPRRER